MNAARFKIFTGPNAGADIDLTPGQWTIGRDDSCDIILQDTTLESRHSVFIVTENDVTARNLDGEVKTVAGDPVESLAPGTSYVIGSTTFAWGASDASPDFWNNIGRDIQAAPRSAAPAPEGGVAAETAKTEEKTEAPSETEDKKVKEQTQKKDSSSIATIVTGVMLCLIAAVGAGTGYWYVTHGDSANQTLRAAAAKDLANLQRMVKNAGFADVTVTQTPTGAVFAGSVRDDAERGRLVKLARMLPKNTAIEVSVDSDYTDPLQSALNSQDFWPEVTLTKKGDTKSLLVSGYMVSSIVEERAFEDAKRTLSASDDIATLPISRRIRHQDDMQRWISAAFKKEGVSDAKVEYLPGRIRVSTVFTPDKKIRLDRAIAAVEKTCDVPVAIDLVNSTPTASAPKSIATTATDPMKPSFRVVDVSGGALKFVKLATGEKIFTGGVLPGGFTLESVNYDRLVLSKNGQRITYPLKVK